MADLKRGARTKAIREYLKTNPSAGPQKIVADLAAQGIEVTLGLVSNVKYGRMRKMASGKYGGSVARVMKTTGISKSASIRGYLHRFPDAKPTEITKGLRKEGVKVTRGLVSNVKFHFMKQAAHVTEAPPAVVIAARKTWGHPEAVTGNVSFPQLLEVKRLVDQLGGAAQVRQALDALELLR